LGPEAQNSAIFGWNGIGAVSHDAWCDLRNFAKREDIRRQKLPLAFETAQSGRNSWKDFAQTPTHYEAELNRRVNELSVEQRGAFDCVASYLHPTQEKQLLASG
jgi:hypothetical protein